MLRIGSFIAICLLFCSCSAEMQEEISTKKEEAKGKIGNFIDSIEAKKNASAEVKESYKKYSEEQLFTGYNIVEITPMLGYIGYDYEKGNALWNELNRRNGKSITTIGSIAYLAFKRKTIHNGVKEVDKKYNVREDIVPYIIDFKDGRLNGMYLIVKETK